MAGQNDSAPLSPDSFSNRLRARSRRLKKNRNEQETDSVAMTSPLGKLAQKKPVRRRRVKQTVVQRSDADASSMIVMEVDDDHDDADAKAAQGNDEDDDNEDDVITNDYKLENVFMEKKSNKKRARLDTEEPRKKVKKELAKTRRQKLRLRALRSPKEWTITSIETPRDAPTGFQDMQDTALSNDVRPVILGKVTGNKIGSPNRERRATPLRVEKHVQSHDDLDLSHYTVLPAIVPGDETTAMTNTSDKDNEKHAAAPSEPCTTHTEPEKGDVDQAAAVEDETMAEIVLISQETEIHDIQTEPDAIEVVSTAKYACIEESNSEEDTDQEEHSIANDIKVTRTNSFWGFLYPTTTPTAEDVAPSGLMQRVKSFLFG